MGGIALVLIVLWSGTAFGQTPTVSGPSHGQRTREVTLGSGMRPLGAAIELQFQGDCLDHDRLVEQVERWLDEMLINGRVRILVTGEQEPLGARFWLLVDDRRVSVRRFEAFQGTCAELRASLSAAIGLALGAVDLSQFPPPPPPPPKPVLPPAKLTARASLSVDEPPPLPPRRPARSGLLQSAAVGAQLLGALGVAPGNAGGAGVRGELGFPGDLTARLSANYLTAEAVPIADGSLGARVLAVQSGGCWGRDTLEYRVQVCVDAWLAAVTAQPSNLDRGQQGTLPWFALVPGAELRFQGGRGFGVRFGTQLSFNVVRPRFEVLYNTRDEPLEARGVPPLGLIGTLGLDWIVL